MPAPSSMIKVGARQTYANIQSAFPLPKGMEAPKLFNSTRLIDINTAPREVIEALPEFILKTMQSAEEWELRQNFNSGNSLKDSSKLSQPLVGQEEENDIPF
ncbi:hypothetical protein [Bradyrhizobium sp. CCGE-LA001]|uniref:hypothetical protein n=1 Tax=Bradyrhizobium sp. CCGE-LA001 TaxID=1223566 RepID=UPI0002AA7961|nr:hypothetical protein [Bradyrhizobium sp. CCGE-LA001]AMA60061.1 hypothetical protein BCCGELA001_30040 [Bradyrhizobium sp. CCGE-LA001]